MQLTGFEVLQDASSNDVYDMASLATILTSGMTLVDNVTPDYDTIMVRNDAVGYAAAPADTISLEVLNDAFTFDFNALDITKVTLNNLIVVGDTDAAVVGRDITTDLLGTGDDLVVGNLDLIDNVSLFETIFFTNASITSAGSEYVYDQTALQLTDGSSNLFTVDANLTGLDFSRVTSGVDITIDGPAATTVVGSQAADTIMGGGGNDRIEGFGGNDVLNGGVATEVQTIDLAGQLAADGSYAHFDFLFQGNLTLDEAAAASTVGMNWTVVDGAGLSVVGAQLATLLNANLTQVNLDWQAWYGAADEVVDSVSYASGVLTFTFSSGVNVANDVDLGFALNGDGGTFTVSATSTINEGGDGGADTYVFEATAAANGVDTIVEFTETATEDILDFQAFLGAGLVVRDAFGAVDGAAGDMTLSGGENVGLFINKGTLAAANIKTAGTAANGEVILADNAKAVILCTADVDGAADTTVNDYNIYYVQDTNSGAGQTWVVTLVGIIDNAAELTSAGLFVDGHFAG